MSLLFASSACIIPVVPEFEDPPAAQNFPPQILKPSPALGIAAGTHFSAVLREVNPSDTVHVKWIADIQPERSTNRFLGDGGGPFPPRADGQPREVPTSVDVSCEGHFLDKTLDFHIIHLLVGNEAFANDGDPRRLTDGEFAVEANWTWVQRCM